MVEGGWQKVDPRQASRPIVGGKTHFKKTKAFVSFQMP
jgi:hypothetical protein